MHQIEKLNKSINSNMKSSGNRSDTELMIYSDSIIEQLDLDTLLQNDTGRKLFSSYLKEYNNSCDNLLTLYLICCCFQNHQRIEDRQRIRQILEKTYNACFIKNELPHLSSDLKNKLGESLQRKTYNESIFSAVKTELKNLLETQYFPVFLQSKTFKENINTVAKIFKSSKSDQNISNSNANLTNISTIFSNESIKLSEKTETPISKQKVRSINQIQCGNSIDKKNASESKNMHQESKKSFAIPNIPILNKKQSNRTLKHSKSSSSSSSSVASSSSISKNSSIKSGKNNIKHSYSKYSLTNELTSKTKTKNHPDTFQNNESFSMPPNPYHVVSKAIPVSAQDSEIQSLVSVDLDDPQNGKKHIFENFKCTHPKLTKLNRQIKENIIANKNVDTETENLEIEPTRKKIENKNQIPLSESNPHEFFKLLSSKLENVLSKENNLSLKTKKNDFSSESHMNFNIDDYDEKSKNKNSFESVNFKENFEKLSLPIESDIDAQLDEHLNRVYNSNNNNIHNENKYYEFDDQLNNVNTKMSFVKVSSLSNDKKMNNHLNVTRTNDISLNGTLMHSKLENHLNDNHPQYSIANDGLSCASLALPAFNNHKLFKELNKSNLSYSSISKSHKEKHFQDESQLHHFYKLTSTSKEVDIDAQSYNERFKNDNEENDKKLPRKYHENFGNTTHDEKPAFNQKNIKHKKININSEINYDSGVSIISAASIERVNDWLSSSGYQQSVNEVGEKNNKNQGKKSIEKNIKKKELDNHNVKTTVAYYLPGEDLAYISTFNGEHLTLAQFKQLITKKGQFRYFFKTKSDLLDEECVVYQEATDESSFVPMFNNKVIAKIEKCNSIINN